MSDILCSTVLMGYFFVFCRKIKLKVRRLKVVL